MTAEDFLNIQSTLEFSLTLNYQERDYEMPRSRYQVLETGSYL